MRLKPIPQNTVVHTPTEEEAKELLAILHENGYKWKYGNDSLFNPIHIVAKEGFCIELGKRLSTYLYIQSAKEDNCTILTLAEFKRKYCEEDKPQPKFKVGDKVYQTSGTDRLVEYTVKKVYMERRGNYIYDLQGLIGIIGVEENDLCFTNQNPYTKLETKPTEDMETNELNLCELLNGHEREVFYHLMYGKVAYKGINEDGFIIFTDSAIPTIYDDGKYDQHANVVLFPSRALYEQYPLDPYTAWQVWQEAQKKYSLRISYQKIIGAVHGCGGKTIDSLSETQCDKCIEEIKAIIEKYSR